VGPLRGAQVVSCTTGEISEPPERSSWAWHGVWDSDRVISGAQAGRNSTATYPRCASTCWRTRMERCACRRSQTIRSSLPIVACSALGNSTIWGVRMKTARRFAASHPGVRVRTVVRLHRKNGTSRSPCRSA